MMFDEIFVEQAFNSEAIFSNIADDINKIVEKSFKLPHSPTAMALKLIDFGSPEYKQMVQLRYNILRKPLGLEFDPQELEKEKHDILLGCFDDGKLEGCCLLTQTGPKE